MKTLFSFCLSLGLLLIPCEAKGSVLSRYRVIPETPSDLKELARRFEVVGRKGNAYELIVPQAKAKQLLSLVPTAVLLQKDTNEELNENLRKNPNFLAGYHTMDTAVAEMKSLQVKHPDLVHVEEYGRSAEGRILYALKLSDNVALDEEEPELMITSATHGDELISVEVVFGLLNALIDGYGMDNRLTKMVDGHEIYVIPVVNPDGYVRRSRYTADGTDPNRDYPWPESPLRQPDPCIKSIINFFNAKNIVGSIDFHAFGEMIMYPWAYTEDPIESVDQKRFSEVTEAMAQSNGYVNGPISKVIYVAKGSSADYYYWNRGSFSLGIEIGRTSVPASSQIEREISANKESTWKFIESF